MVLRRNWIKIYVDQCLRGTMMDEMTNPAERFIWFGFLLLAGDSPINGKIAITENMGYTDEQLGALLKCDSKIITSAKQKMVKYDKISTAKNNVIEIVNWGKYQSEYQRQKPYREDEKLQPKVTTKSDALDRDRDKIENKIRKEEKKEKTTSSNIAKITFDFTQKKFLNITEEDKTIWKEAYPGCDIKQELLKMRSWLIADPKRQKTQYKRFINNWLARVQNQGGTKGITKKRESYIEGSERRENIEKKDKLKLKLHETYRDNLKKAMKKYGWKTEEDVDYTKFPYEDDFIQGELEKMEIKDE
jgi:hypothetical protein